ncbi:hypothetical protein E2562_020547 [Oryza meyeriana var. granulata]|uniref:Protein kinase domain-containing protein n=1 Tax=Oryza meyeriana var. granulata TaxID=110450 RepID=A0A6G1EB25_9ORYZ|nr:hypothetical protein E2562_020547 [Oryza meyeriana var. granulata]
MQNSGRPTAKADILSRIASLFVVRCHAVRWASTAGDVALLLELEDGGLLDSIMSRHGVFPEAAMAEVAAQALSGLAYLHAHRVVHLDVKPANLLASTDGNVKVADFGIAKRTAGHYDPCIADVWGLGVTVLELLVGWYLLLPAGQKPSWVVLMCAICFDELPALPERASVVELLAHPFVAKRDVAVSRRALWRLVA